jgi:hypothetical protein
VSVVVGGSIKAVIHVPSNKEGRKDVGHSVEMVDYLTKKVVSGPIIFGMSINI